MGGVHESTWLIKGPPASNSDACKLCMRAAVAGVSPSPGADVGGRMRGKTSVRIQCWGARVRTVPIEGTPLQLRVGRATMQST